MTPRWRAAVLLGATLLLPIMANRDAYRGYFDSDDFGSINWARFVPLDQYLRDLPDLRYQRGRPLGFFYYGTLIRTVGLHFPPWALILQFIGLLNLTLLWLVLRKLQFGDIEAALGCLFFGANSALFDGWWRPAFVYDVLATTFAIVTVLAYLHRRWVVSFVAFWLSMRSKEIGIVLPAVLLCYEMTLGKPKVETPAPVLRSCDRVWRFGSVVFDSRSAYAVHS
jgi:hypothetical protein